MRALTLHRPRPCAQNPWMNINGTVMRLKPHKCQDAAYKQLLQVQVRVWAAEAAPGVAAASVFREGSMSPGRHLAVRVQPAVLAIPRVVGCTLPRAIGRWG